MDVVTMTTIARLTLLLILLASAAPIDQIIILMGPPKPLPPTAAGGGTLADCEEGTVQAAHDAASNGATITCPAGSFTWTSGVSITKAVTIQGASGGKVEGSSTTSLAIGTGSKSFTLRSGSVLVGFTAGQTVRARVKYVPSYMEGTVTSWDSGAGVLVLNIASVSGSGTHAMWTFQTPGTTQITHNASTNTLFTLGESSAGNLTLSRIQFIRGTGMGPYVTTAEGVSGEPILVHDVQMEATSGGQTINVAVNRGVFYRLYMHASFNWDSMSNNIDTAAGPRLILPLTDTASWGSASTMGTADTTGKNNVYFEDSYFVGLTTECFDVSEASRAVIRNSIFDNSAIGTHSTDTGLIGIRHVEIYDNTLIFNSTSGDNGDGDSTTPGMDYFFFVRGGTYVFTGNAIDNITSTDWGNKSEIKMVVENLQRSAGPYFCYDSNNNHASQSGFGSNGYPLPRQVGQGRVTGASGNDSFSPFVYKGDLEPAYIWSNTGTVLAGLANYGSSECEATFGSPRPDVSEYIQVDRDYYDGTAKPGYTKKAYPHPLRPS